MMRETLTPSKAAPAAASEVLPRPASTSPRTGLREQCGVFGIFDHPDAAAIVALGLHALQHRGQEAAGIVAFDGARFHSERRQGLVGDHFSSGATIDRLPGRSAIGHVRYSTTGETVLRNVQPLFAELEAGGLAVAHNGNLTNGLTLRRELIRGGAICQSTTDTEVVLLARGALAPAQDRRPFRRSLGRDRGRLRARCADQQEADRRPRSARHPPAGPRRTRRQPDPVLGDLRARHHRREIRPRRRERRSRGHRRRRRDEFLPAAQAADAALHIRVRLFRPARSRS